MRPGAPGPLWPLSWGALAWAAGFVGSGDPAPGGVCWLQQGGEDTCSLVLRTDVSQADCCASGSIDTAWSNLTHPGNKISLLGFLGLVHCLPCRDSCDGVECGPGKACRMLGGRPRCECAPDCAGLPARLQVCGSDGATYRDECELRATRCRGHPDLRVMYRGRCRSTVLRARGVPAATVLRGGPDGQRALRGLPGGALPRALQPRPGAVWQRQRHLRVLVSLAPGHLLPGPLHRRAPPGQLHRTRRTRRTRTRASGRRVRGGAGAGAGAGAGGERGVSPTRCLAESVFRARGPRRSRRRGRKAGTSPGARSTGPGDAGPAPLGINLSVVAAPPARPRTRGDLGPGTRGEEGSSPGRGDENRTGWRLRRPPLSSGPPGGGRGRPGPGHAAAPRSLGLSAGCAAGGAGAGVRTAGRAGRAWPPGLLHSAQGPAPPAAAPSPSAAPGHRSASAACVGGHRLRPDGGGGEPRREATRCPESGAREDSVTPRTPEVLTLERPRPWQPPPTLGALPCRGNKDPKTTAGAPGAPFTASRGRAGQGRVSGEAETLGEVGREGDAIAGGVGGSIAQGVPKTLGGLRSRNGGLALMG